MFIESPALTRFTDQIETAPWFSSLGQTLTLEETDYAKKYINLIGLEAVKISKITSWVEAENLIKAPDWSESWWIAEEQTRKSLTSCTEKNMEERVYLNLLLTLLAADQILYMVPQLFQQLKGEWLIRA